MGETGRGGEGVRREWVRQTMEAVRRRLCDSTERGKGMWVRVGSPHGGSEKQGLWKGVLSNCKVEKPMGVSGLSQLSEEQSKKVSKIAFVFPLRVSPWKVSTLTFSRLSSLLRKKKQTQRRNELSPRLHRRNNKCRVRIQSQFPSTPKDTARHPWL